MRVRTAWVAVAVACSLGIAGCNWVPLSAGGEQVQLATPNFVEGCRSLGKTKAKTKPTLLGIKRGEATIREELTSLARNDAAAMGGTHVSPLDDVKEGEQTFGIYVCSGSGGGD
jgi:hypothetical protein